MDIVGAEKFLQVQGFTYYGSLYVADDLKSRQSNKPYIPDQIATCGYID